ncbi:S-adenosyl-L-methionine-dependent methyltransferase [Gongronella butleri]|nr:S-adenosyl-L-methionine-dependent methyltransferase [Gongronella butleri]
MGNQHSRMERRLGSTASQDPRLTSLPEWAPPQGEHHDGDYHRQYPMPALRSSHGRIKLRKQSSPTIRLSHASSTHHHQSRRPLSRVFPFRAFRDRTGGSVSASASIGGGSINTMDPQQLTPSSSLLAISDIPAAASSNHIHPLLRSNIAQSLTQHQQQQNSQQQQALGPQSLSSPAHSISPPTPSPSTYTPSSSHHNLHDLMHLKPELLLDTQPEIIWIDGRKFFGSHVSSYVLPCDEEEIDRLHLLHFMVRFAIQGNYLAPVTDHLRKGATVLDIGCGPGSWTMEIAGEYPKSTIVGVDMASMFPKDIKPLNCQFYQCDVLRGLPFQDATFDYVFMRFMGHGIERDQWPTVLQDILRVLKPGGWMEIVEFDLELHRPGPVTKQYNQQLISLMEARNLDPHCGRKLKDQLHNMDSLHHVQGSFISCPGGKWAGKLGQLALQSWKAYYRALQPPVCVMEGISVDEYNQKLDICWDETDEYKTFENIHFAYGQKKQIAPSSTS